MIKSLRDMMMDLVVLGLGRAVGDDDGGRAGLSADEVVLAIATSAAVGGHNTLTPEADTVKEVSKMSILHNLKEKEGRNSRRAKLMVNGQAKLISLDSALLKHKAVLGVTACDDLGGQTWLALLAEELLGVVTAELEGDGLDGLLV